jgi:hypothetical protein
LADETLLGPCGLKWTTFLCDQNSYDGPERPSLEEFLFEAGFFYKTRALYKCTRKVLI